MVTNTPETFPIIVIDHFLKHGSIHLPQYSAKLKNERLHKMRPLLEYGVVCWDTHRGQVSALNRVQKRAAKFENNINESGWETLAQRRLIARTCALYKA
jgi:hypothetical protein